MAGILNGLRTCLLVATSASDGSHINSQGSGLLVSRVLHRPLEPLPPRPALVTLWAWWQGPLLRQLIFLTQQGLLLGIPNVKAVGFYISEGHLGDQPGRSSARVSACTNRVVGRGGGQAQTNFQGRKLPAEEARARWCVGRCVSLGAPEFCAGASPTLMLLLHFLIDFDMVVRMGAMSGSAVLIDVKD